MRDGWLVLRRAPGAVLAEIIWRWTFGATALVLIFLSFHQYFSSIQITAAEYRLLKSLQPFTWMEITTRIMVALTGGVRALAPILVPALSVLWLALATIGRAISIRVLTKEDGRTNWLALFALNFCRLAIGFIAFLAYFGVGIIVSNVLDPAESLGLNVLIMCLVLLSLATFVSVVNWYLSTAAIFAAHEKANIRDSLRKTAALKGTGTVNVLFMIMRLVLVGVVTYVSLMMLGSLSQPAHRVIPLTIIIFMTLLYYAVSDWLYMWRLAAYISLTEPEVQEFAKASAQPTTAQPAQGVPQL